MHVQPGARAATVVLVEGISDRIALTTLARRCGYDLAALGADVVDMGGATNIGRYLATYADTKVRVAGLCDQGETRFFRKGLARSGRAGPGVVDADLPGLGFYVCARDLEDELIRCLGAHAVEAVVEDEGERTAWRTFQRQPAQRARPVEAQLRRFLGTHSGRKAQYARALVEALDPARPPQPLAGLLRHLGAGEVDAAGIPAPHRLTT